MRKFRIVAIAIAAVLLMASVGCTTARTVTITSGATQYLTTVTQPAGTVTNTVTQPAVTNTVTLPAVTTTLPPVTNTVTQPPITATVTSPPVTVTTTYTPPPPPSAVDSIRFTLVPLSVTNGTVAGNSIAFSNTATNSIIYDLTYTNTSTTTFNNVVIQVSFQTNITSGTAALVSLGGTNFPLMSTSSGIYNFWLMPSISVPPSGGHVYLTLNLSGMTESTSTYIVMASATIAN